MKRIIVYFFICFALFCFTSCEESNTVRILASNESEQLQGTIEKWGKDNGIPIQMTLKTNMEIMSILKKDECLKYDAFITAQSFYTQSDHKNCQVERPVSVYSTLNVLGMQKHISDSYGWSSNEVTVEQIINQEKNGKLHIGVASASRSNSGLMLLLGLLGHFTSNKDVLTKESLSSPDIASNLKDFYSGVSREAGGTSSLEDVFLNSNKELNGLVTYESSLIRLNQKLSNAQKEPLNVFYIKGLAGSVDAKMTSLSNLSERHKVKIEKLGKFFQSPEFQNQLSSLGYRSGIGGGVRTSNKSVFDPAFDFDEDKVVSVLPLPTKDVILNALQIYQQQFRKPMLAVLCLDFSDSMSTSGAIKELKSGIDDMFNIQVLESENEYFNPGDVFVVLLFSDRVLKQIEVHASDSTALDGLRSQVNNMRTSGGTDIYSPVIVALEYFNQQSNLEQYSPHIMLLTDGESNSGKKLDDVRVTFEKYHGNWKSRGISVAFYGIGYDAANDGELEQLVKLFGGKSFHADNLKNALHEIGGYR